MPPPESREAHVSKPLAEKVTVRLVLYHGQQGICEFKDDAPTCSWLP